MEVKDMKEIQDKVVARINDHKKEHGQYKSRNREIN